MKYGEGGKDEKKKKKEKKKVNKQDFLLVTRQGREIYDKVIKTRKTLVILFYFAWRVCLSVGGDDMTFVSAH